MSDDETYGVKGFEVIGEFLKSRSSEAGRKFTMVFSQAEGFLNDMSNLLTLKEEGEQKGSPRGYFFDNLPDFKFTTKTFREKFAESEEFRNAIQEKVEEVFVNYIPNNHDYDEEEDENDEALELVKCIDKKKDIWLGSDGNYYNSDGEELEYEE